MTFVKWKWNRVKSTYWLNINQFDNPLYTVHIKHFEVCRLKEAFCSDYICLYTFHFNAHLCLETNWLNSRKQLKNETSLNNTHQWCYTLWVHSDDARPLKQCPLRRMRRFSWWQHVATDHCFSTRFCVYSNLIWCLPWMSAQLFGDWRFNGWESLIMRHRSKYEARCAWSILVDSSKISHNVTLQIHTKRIK